MPLSPLPVCLLPSRCPHLSVQQQVAVLVQLLVPLGRCDPHSARAQLGSAKATHKPSRRSDPKRQCHRQRAAREQLSPAGKAASASSVCELKQLLGAYSETPAWAVQLPARVSEHNESRRVAESKLPDGKGSAELCAAGRASASPTTRSEAWLQGERKHLSGPPGPLP